MVKPSEEGEGGEGLKVPCEGAEYTKRNFEYWNSDGAESRGGRGREDSNADTTPLLLLSLSGPGWARGIGWDYKLLDPGSRGFLRSC